MVDVLLLYDGGQIDLYKYELYVVQEERIERF